MKWVLITPETLIQPRAISSPPRAYVSSDSPRPPYSSGIINPKIPSSLRPSTISVGYSSACSSSVATGRISFSTNERTAPRISVWMSLRPSVSHRRGMRSVLLWWRSGRSERYWWVDGLAMTHLTSRLVGPPALLRRPVPAPEQQWPQARKPVHQRQPDPWVVGAVALRLDLAAQRPTLVAQVTHVVQHPGRELDGD